jgi:hypothetical protein
MEATTQQLKDILRKVEALLAKAESTTFPAEAEAFRAKAEALMYSYRLDEAMLQKASPVGVKPQWAEIFVCTLSEFSHIYRQMASSVISHFDTKAVFLHTLEGYTMRVVGFESDLMFIDALWQSLRLAFADRMEPKVNPAESDRVNAYRLRKAGIEGRRIAQMIYGREDKSLRVKVRGYFRDEAIARGEDPAPLLGRSVNVKSYRTSYAAAFEDEIFRRLFYMKQSRGEQSQGLVLADRAGAIAEAFYEENPHLRPAPAGTPRIGNEQGACPKCAKAKSGYCREHSYMRPRMSRGPRANSAGLAAGREAARSVDLGTRGRLDK